jgi:hypothetical protein
LVFILGVGRSGTTLLSKLLQNDGMIVRHEPPEMVRGDRNAYVERFQRRKYNPDYFKGERKKFINRQLKKKTYIEINGYLRLHIPILKEVFPDAIFIQIVRDPKAVIRSMMSKKKSILPSLQRSCKKILFQMCCNIWAEENKEVRLLSDGFIRLEDILTDFDEYKKKLLKPLGIKQGKRQWEKIVSHKVNATKKFTFPKYEMWTKKNKRFFQMACKEEANRYGYKM